MKTLLFIATILLYIVRCISAEESTELSCNDIEEKTLHYQLKRHIFCNYDPVRRTHGLENKTTVNFYFIPQLARYNDWDNTLELHLYLYLTWIDNQLNWSPTNYSGIDIIHVKSDEIWSPEVYSFNSNYGDIDPLPVSRCEIYSGGEVYFSSAVRFKASCIADYKYWPYDERNCTLQLGSWVHSTQEVVFGNNSVHLRMESFEGSSEWKLGPSDTVTILKREKLLTEQTFQSVGIHFSMIRVHSSLASTVISPVIILTIVSLTTLWLKPGSTERLILSCVNVLGHILTVKNIHWLTPHTGNKLPNIMIFYHNSFILAVIAMIFTCWLQRLSDWKSQVPPWLSGKIAIILASKPGKMLLMNFSDPSESAILQEDADDNSGLVNSDSKESKWHSVVIVIGWISFIAFFMIYLVMFAVFLRFPSLESSGITYY